MYLKYSAFVKEVELHGRRMFENEAQRKAFRPRKWKEMEDGKFLFGSFKFVFFTSYYLLGRLLQGRADGRCMAHGKYNILYPLS
jgi:hypothetical protein